MALLGKSSGTAVLRKAVSEENRHVPGACGVSLQGISHARNFRYVKTSPEIIRLAAMMYNCHPLSLQNVEDLLHERGIDITHETVRFWWNRFGTIFAAKIRRSRVQAMLRFRQMRSLQKFTADHGSIHNHFNQELHLSSTPAFKDCRTAALAEWRQLCAA